MNSPNIQKLITTFLILAALTSSFVFLLSNTKTGAPINPVVVGSGGASLDGQNAFALKTAQLQNYVSPLADRSNINEGSGGNLTDTFASALTKQVMAANPEGPQKDKSGKFALSSPKSSAADINAIISSLQIDPLPKVSDSQIKIASKYSKDDAQNYLSAVGDILKTLDGDLPNKTAYQSKFSRAAMDAINLSFLTATSKLYGLNVPAPLASFHETLLSSVLSQSNFFNTTDPLKSYALISDAKDILAAQKKQLTSEFVKLKNNLPALFAKAEGANGISARVAALLGIQEAHAILGVGDIVLDIITEIESTIDEVMNGLSYALDLESSILDYVIQLLKDELIHRLTQAVITWAQGGGTPQFVTNWKGFLGDAFTGAANNIISTYAPGLCADFRPLLTVALTPPPKGVGYSAQDNPYTCTVDMIKANAEGFAQNFESGGWLAYGSLLQPQNNFYGALISLGDASRAAGASAQTAAQSEAQSGSGFTGGKECAHENTVDISLNGEPRDIGFLENDPDFIRGTDCEGNVCNKAVFCDEYQTTTPGTTEAAATNNAVTDSPIQTIVNEDGLTGILSALMNSALTKLIDSGKKGLLSLTAAQLADRSGNAASALCSGLGSATSAAYQNCVKQNETIQGIASGVSNASKATVVGNLNQLITRESDVLDATNNTANLIVQTIGALTLASSTCTASLAGSMDIDALNTMSFINNNLDQLQGTGGTGGYLDEYNARIADLSASPGGKIIMLNDILNTVSSGSTSTILALAAKWKITVPPTGTDEEKLAAFFKSFEQAMNNPTSEFSSFFGSVPALVGERGQRAQFGQTLSQPPKACGILDKAQAVASSCSLAAADQLCK